METALVTLVDKLWRAINREHIPVDFSMVWKEGSGKQPELMPGDGKVGHELKLLLKIVWKELIQNTRGKAFYSNKP